MSRETRRHLLLLALFLAAYTAIALLAPHEKSDEASYLVFADNLVNGFYSGRGDDVDLWFGPGLPLLVAPLVAADAPIEVIRLLGPVLLFTTVVVFYFLLRLTVSARAALGGAMALALYLPLLTLLPTLHSEIPALLWTVCFMACFTLDVRNPQFRWLLLAGGSLAALAVTRVVFGWILALALIVALVAAVFRRTTTTKRTALVAAVGLLLASPWLAYTYSVAHKPFYWSSSGGLSLYWMASPYPDEHGDWHSTDDVFSDERLAAHRPFFKGVRELNQVEFDSELRGQALEWIRESPIEYAENVAANTSRLWFSMPYSFTPQKLSTTFYALPNALLLGGLLFAVVVFLIVRRAPPEAFGFAILLVIGLVFQASLAAYARMLVPLVPLMIWFIVQAAVCLAPRDSSIVSHEA